MFKGERIDYNRYLRDKPQEADPLKIGAMATAVHQALHARYISGTVSAVYYQDGCIRVSVDGKYYGMFDSNTGKFFSGYVGDYQKGGTDS